ncbi:MFS transporter [Streptomyces sp. NRRL F-525]|uniref:MFS transporter n=1 Tax=Streptomyces sp. NRRL F-525 TaxID=1463861 RepID=UPI000524A069|nr:MFS transporter [Streptomyces sp. NRRL F-525]
MTTETHPNPRRWWGLGALALAGLVIGLDLTILNVALPTLATSLHASTQDLQWFANAYNLVLAALLLPAGLLGDRYGRKLFLLGGLVVFGAASALCAYSTSAGELIGARALLGLGAAFLTPMTLAMLPVLFEERERSRAVAVWITANSVGIPLGPIIGGALLDRFWWGSVFLLNVPVIALALIAGFVLLPSSKSPDRPTLDLLGTLTSSAGLVGITFGMIEAGQKGWSDAAAYGPIVAGVVFLMAFVLWQARAGRTGRRPLVDLALFRPAGFRWGTALGLICTFAMFGLLFTMPQYFQVIDGANALGTGLRLLPVVGGMLVGTRIADRIGPKAGAKVVVTIGFVVMGIGLLSGALTGTGTGYGYAAAWFAVVGAGLGFAMPTAMAAALGSVSAERAGVASAVFQAMRTVGGTVGVAVLGTVLNTAYVSRLHLTGLPAQATTAIRKNASGGIAVADRLGSASLRSTVSGAFVHALDTMLVVCGVVALVGAVLTVVFLPGGRAEPAAEDKDAPAAAAGAVV